MPEARTRKRGAGRKPGDKTGKEAERKEETPRGVEAGFIQAVASARVVYRGGNVNNAANGGAGYVNVNNALSNSNANIGARLAE